MAFEDLFSSTEEKYGLPAGYLNGVGMIESRLDPNARNPNSSAGGLFQFIDSTARDYGLRNRFDPAEATDAAGRLARDNAAVLRQALGRDPTPGELYLAHQQGAGGAVKLLTNPDAPAETIVGEKAARLNGGAGLTAGQMAQKWTSKLDGGQPLNPSIARAATRGRNPADMPAGNAAEAEGVFPQPQQPVIDPMRNETGLQGRQLQVAAEEQRQGQAPGMPAGGASGFFVPPGQSAPGQRVGGLGGLGGFLTQAFGGQPQAAPATPAGSVESMIPAAATDPFALFGKGARENQEAIAERQGKVALGNYLISKGFTPQQAVGMLGNETFLKLAMADKTLERTTAANAQAIAGLAGGGAPATTAPSSSTAATPQAGGYNPVADRSLSGANLTDRAKLVAPLRTLMDPNVSKELKEAAMTQYRNVLDESKLTTTQKEYLYAKAQGYAGTMMDYQTALKQAGKAEVNIKSEGTIPPGYRVERDAQGQPVQLTPIPGGPADQKAKAEAEKADLAKKQTAAAGNVVLNALADIDKLMASATLPTTGAMGARVSEIGGTAAHDIANALTTIKANIGFDRLSQMRAASPTGGALGSVSDAEQKLLANSAAALEQSQSPEQFRANLARLRSQYNMIVHGDPNGPDGLKRPDGSSPPQPSGAAATPSAQAVEYLKANPGLRAQFDQKYGAGSSARVLGQ